MAVAAAREWAERRGGPRPAAARREPGCRGPPGGRWAILGTPARPPPPGPLLPGWLGPARGSGFRGCGTAAPGAAVSARTGTGRGLAPLRPSPTGRPGVAGARGGDSHVSRRRRRRWGWWGRAGRAGGRAPPRLRWCGCCCLVGGSSSRGSGLMFGGAGDGRRGRALGGSRVKGSCRTFEGGGARVCAGLAVAVAGAAAGAGSGVLAGVPGGGVGRWEGGSRERFCSSPAVVPAVGARKAHSEARP